MDWSGLICSLIALAAGLFAYIAFVNSEIGKKYEKYQYAVMVVCLILACVIGGILKAIF